MRRRSPVRGPSIVGGVIVALAITPAAAGDRGAEAHVIVRLPDPSFEDLRGVQLEVRYATDRLTFAPGEAAGQGGVRASLADPEHDDLLQAKADTGVVRIVWVRQPAQGGVGYQGGAFAVVPFVVRGDGTPPQPSCVVTAASESNGQRVDGVSCAVELR